MHPEKADSHPRIIIHNIPRRRDMFYAVDGILVCLSTKSRGMVVMGPTRRDSDLAILVASERRASAVSCRVARRFRHSTELNGRVCASDLT